MKKKKEKIGEVSWYEILLNQRVMFRKATKVEDGRKKARREKETLRKYETEDYYTLKAV